MRLELTENLENKAEEPGSAKGSRKSQKFVFLFLMITPLSVRIELSAKGINLAVACGVDARCLQMRTRVLSGPHVEAG